MSDWKETLRDACAASSQKKVADRLGVSATVVNQVLHDKYPGNLNRVKGLVEFVLTRGAAVQCPVLGEIGNEECLAYQRQPFAATNAQRVRLFRACRNGCPHSRIGE